MSVNTYLNGQLIPITGEMYQPSPDKAGWSGTQAEFEAQKGDIPDGALVNITDDGGNDPLFVSNEVKQGELTPVTSNAVYDYVTNSLYQGLFDIIFPVNNAYEVQYLDAPEPNAKYNINGKIKSEWIDVTSSVDGDFMKFRADVGSGTPESAGLPNIKGIASLAKRGKSIVGMIDGTDGAFSTDRLTGISIGYDVTSLEQGSRLIIDASKSNTPGAECYGKSTTVTPQNKSVKLWKRIK